MSLISATHYAYAYGDGHSAVETRTFGNLKTARMWASEVLGTITTTNDCYWRDTARAGHVELTRVVRHKHVHDRAGAFYCKQHTAAGQVEPQVVIVPSVGELGYW